MKLFYIFLMVILLAGCSQASHEAISGAAPNPAVSESETVHETVDVITIGGKHYHYAWELTIVDTKGLIELGDVKRGSFVTEDTPVYEIAGYPDRELIAVKTNSKNSSFVTNTSGYLVYVLQSEDGGSRYPEFENQQIQQIKIFRDNEFLREVNGKDVNAFLSLFNQHGPHNEFPFDTGTKYTVLFIGDHALGQNYGVMEKDGHLGLAHIESKLPDEIADFFK